MIKPLNGYFNLKSLGKGLFLYLFSGIMMMTACKNDNKIELTAPSRATFSTTAFVLEKDQSTAYQVTINLAQPMAKAGTVSVTITDGTTALATQFTTVPAATSNVITLALDKGATSASFTIMSAHNFDDLKTVAFKISAATGGAVTGETNQTTTATMRGNNWLTPAVNASVTSLATFGVVTTATLSAAKTFTLTAQNISGAVSITSSDNFKISLDNITYASSLSTSVTTTPVTIYVKFSPASGKNQDLTGTITASATAANSATIAVAGTESGNIAFVPEVPLLTENFDYGTTSDFLTRLNAAWVPYSAAGSIPVVYIPKGLTFPRYAGSGVGGSITIEHGDFSREDVDRVITPKTTGVVYVAAMINISAAGTGDFFMAMHDASGSFFNRLYAKDDGAGNLVIGVGKNSTAQYPTTGVLKYNTTYVIVTKYDFTAKTSTLYIMDGALTDTEPTTSPAVSSAGTAPTTLNDVVIRQSDGVMSVNIDGIRVATTWRGALGI